MKIIPKMCLWQRKIPLLLKFAATVVYEFDFLQANPFNYMDIC